MRYDGDWKADKKNGEGKCVIRVIGVYVYANGDRYEGMWRNDKRNDRGS